MKLDYSDMLTDHGIPIYNHLGIPCYLTVEDMAKYRAAGCIGAIRCQHCGKEFLIMSVWDVQENAMGFRKPVMELPEHWDYGDPPFHYVGFHQPCIGNTMLSITEYEFGEWHFRQSELLASIGLS